MDKYAKLKIKADELSRLLRVPFPGNETWDRQFKESIDGISVFCDDDKEIVEEISPTELEPEGFKQLDLVPIGEMKVPELRVELESRGIKHKKLKKPELMAAVSESRRIREIIFRQQDIK